MDPAATAKNSKVGGCSPGPEAQRSRVVDSNHLQQVRPYDYARFHYVFLMVFLMISWQSFQMVALPTSIVTS